MAYYAMKMWSSSFPQLSMGFTYTYKPDRVPSIRECWMGTWQFRGQNCFFCYQARRRRCQGYWCHPCLEVFSQPL